MEKGGYVRDAKKGDGRIGTGEFYWAEKGNGSPSLRGKFRVQEKREGKVTLRLGLPLGKTASHGK